MIDHPATVIVTGAASGIGAAVARRLSDERHVWAADLDTAGLERLAFNELGGTTRHVDVRDAAALDRLVAEADGNGDLDVVVACAGVSCVGTATEADPARWQLAIDVNTLGVMYLIRAALPVLIARGTGTIVVVASASGRLSYVGEPAYIASKHATVAFCDAVRKEIVGTGVRMCVVEPGLVDTPMSRGHPAIDEVIGAVTPLDPDDIARVVAFAIAQPPGCSINEIVVRPTDQDL